MKALIRHLDPNGDGKINFKEFCHGVFAIKGKKRRKKKKKKRKRRSLTSSKHRNTTKRNTKSSWLSFSPFSAACTLVLHVNADDVKNNCFTFKSQLWVCSVMDSRLQRHKPVWSGLQQAAVWKIKCSLLLLFFFCVSGCEEIMKMTVTPRSVASDLPSVTDNGYVYQVKSQKHVF